MTDTVREKILDNIETTLKGIKTASGYGNDIVSVQRWEQAGNSLVKTPCIIINSGPEEKEHRPGLIISCKFSVIIDLWIRHDKNSFVKSTDSYLSSLLGDIEKVLMIDHTRGDYAAATRILSIIPFETTSGQPYAGLTIECEIEYRHLVSDPTQQV